VKIEIELRIREREGYIRFIRLSGSFSISQQPKDKISASFPLLGCRGLESNGVFNIGCKLICKCYLSKENHMAVEVSIRRNQILIFLPLYPSFSCDIVWKLDGRMGWNGIMKEN